MKAMSKLLGVVEREECAWLGEGWQEEWQLEKKDTQLVSQTRFSF